MTEEKPLPPPFILGEKYEDEISEYTVVSIEEPIMTFRRTDGKVYESHNILLKSQIHNRRCKQREYPRPSNVQPSAVGSGTHGYRDEDVTWIVAQCIDQLAKRSKDCIPHKRIAQALLEDPATRRIIENANRLSADHKTLEGRTGQIIARFSSECYRGEWPGYKKEKISRGHCWKVERR
jgi:hypothetical protein